MRKDERQEWLRRSLYELNETGMLRQELKHVGLDIPLDFSEDELAHLREAALKANLSALCLSGGGIRSAVFSLGVIQGLAQYGLLKQFDYLSTVSGGGYIGAWLKAWIHRCEGVSPLESVEKQLATPADPIRYLQAHCRYLQFVPGLPAGSGQGFSGVLLPKLLLNWFAILPVLTILVLLPGLLIAAYGSPPDSLFWHFAGLGVAGLPYCYLYLNYRPFAQDFLKDRISLYTFYFAPLLLYIFGSSCAWVSLNNLIRQSTGEMWTPRFLLHYFPALWPAVYCVALSMTGQFAGCLAAMLFARRPVLFLRAIPALLAASIVEGGILYEAGTRIMPDPLRNVVLYSSLVIPVLLGIHIVTITVYSTLQRRLIPEIDWTWWEEARTRIAAIAVGWLALHSVVVFGPRFVRGLSPLFQIGLAVAAVLAAMIFSTLVYSSSAKIGASSKESLQAAWQRNALLSLSGAAVATGLLISTAMIAQAIASSGVYSESGFGNLALVFGILCLAPFLIGFFIDPNDLSIHGVYRDSLVRTFLGASWHRKPDPLTDIDRADDLPMHKLGQRPFPVINLARKTAGETTPSSFQRLTQPFVVTPLQCGNPVLGYRASEEYAGCISLGTAMAVSGAAVSLNLGDRTSAWIRFLKGLLNARLGIWLENPKFKYRLRSLHALTPFLKESLGRESDDDPYVYLSDGGHFENLGLYEMLRRRCRMIVVVDAGSDPTLTFDDLANAASKARTDLLIPIEIDVRPIMERLAHVVAGRIGYSSVQPNAPDGYLIYFKPSLIGDEELDIRNYAMANASFPHESTADQWFSEAQFESYRRLGLHSVQQAAKAVGSMSLLEFGARLRDGDSGRPPAAAVSD